MSQKTIVSRRRFLGGAAAAAVGAPQWIPASALGKDAAVSPGSRITVGFIGTGSHGIGRDLSGFLAQADAQAVAVCDVDSRHREAARRLAEQHYAEAMKQGTYKGCRAYHDFRDVIDRDDIDAVCNATPDHWHVIPSVMAIKAGKDVLCEKPLTLTLAEGRVLCETVRRYRPVFQTASENRSIGVYHRMCELVRNGRIGELKHIEVGLPAGHSVQQASMEFTDPPKGFDYDMWLGQAPYAPYCPARCHWNFRWILDYSGGQLTDWAHHLVDIAQWGNNTEDTMPIEVEGTGTFPTEGLYNTATQYHCKYRYANGVTMDVVSKGPSLRFEGTEGWVGNRGWCGRLEGEPASMLDSQMKPNEIHLSTCPGGEIRNFLDCVKSRRPCYSPAENGHRAAGIAHLGNIAMMVGKKLQWDPRAERFDDDEANQLRSRPMRGPWTL
ncbi:MAG: Gfo/Idh/MocA family oxidoreductase [Pirellulales bacterium]|nr:Gfo/Idh/MocA family oxidoreductase [Pirellulales bacterium]